jgi:hypothetical protein
MFKQILPAARAGMSRPMVMRSRETDRRNAPRWREERRPGLGLQPTGHQQGRSFRQVPAIASNLASAAKESQQQSDGLEKLNEGQRDRVEHKHGTYDAADGPS